MKKDLMTKIRNDVYPALLSGAISLGAFSILFGGSIYDRIPILGMRVPAYIGTSGITFASHLGSNIVSDIIEPYVPVAGRNYFLAGTAVGKSVLAGGLVYGFNRGLVSSEATFIPSFGLGAGSVMASELASDFFFQRQTKI